MAQYGIFKVTAMVIHGKTKYAVKAGDQILFTYPKIGDAVKKALALNKAEIQGKKYTKALAKAGISTGKKLFKYLKNYDKPKRKKRKGGS